MNSEQAEEVLGQQLVDILRAVGLTAETAGTSDSGTELRLHLDDRILEIDLKATPTIDPGAANRLRRKAARDRIPLLVADRIPDGARVALRDRGWSYLDRRGRLFLRGPGLLIDADVPGIERPVKRRPGRAWREVAFALLVRPEQPWGVRQLARATHLSPASVSKQLMLLRQAQLADDDHRPLLPELFWELAGHWRSATVLLDRRPVPDESSSLDLGLEDPTRPGWALTGTLAAMTWGAPVPTGSDWPPDFLVPSPEHVSRALRRLGPAPEATTRSCTVTVAPVRQAIQPRFDPPDPHHAPTEWLLTHPLAVALDLAQDKARGVEILDDWTPDGFARVW